MADDTKDQTTPEASEPQVRTLTKVQVARTNRRNQTEIVEYPAGKRLPASTFTAEETEQLVELRAIRLLDAEDAE